MSDFTTAECRAKAQTCEDKLDWIAAMYWWNRAIAAYPDRSGSALAKRDLAILEDNRATCASTASDPAYIKQVSDRMLAKYGKQGKAFFDSLVS